jgi:hypothetical protein
MTAPKLQRPAAAGPLDDETLLASLVDYLGVDDARVARIMAPLRERYVSSSRDDLTKEQLRHLIVNAVAARNSKAPRSLKNRRAGIGLVIVAPSGAGKTRMLDWIFRNHPAFPGFGIEDARCALISIDCPSPSTLGQIGNTILEELGYFTEKTLPENDAWKRVRHQLWKQRILFLHLGDINHIMRLANRNEILKIADTLKNLMISKRWPVQIIIDGTPDMIAFPKDDRQLSRRLKFLRLGNVAEATDGAMIRAAMKDYARDAGLRLVVKPADLLVARLCRAAAFQMGLVFEILLDAIQVSVRARRKTLTITDFAAAYANRTLQPVDLNMFLSGVWDTLDPSVIYESPDGDDKAGGKTA